MPGDGGATVVERKRWSVEVGKAWCKRALATFRASPAGVNLKLKFMILRFCK